MPAPSDQGSSPPRGEMLMRMTIEGLEEMQVTIRISLDHADKTAETLRDWLRMVDDELERKAGF